MVPLSKEGMHICECPCLRHICEPTRELFIFREALMPFSAPERAGVAAFAVWAWWWCWLFRECVCWLWLQTSWLLSGEWPQEPGHVSGYSTAEWTSWPLVWLSSLSVLCAFHQAQQEVWSDFCCTSACCPLPSVCYSWFFLALVSFL